MKRMKRIMEDKEEEFEEKEEATAARRFIRPRHIFMCIRYKACKKAKCSRAKLCGRRPGYCAPFVDSLNK